ncbi:hypothetical protein B0J15DRAFT_378356, partial [Fusarium solani]
GQFTPPTELTNNLFFPGTYDDRARSNSLSIFIYSAYPAPNKILIAPYGSLKTYLAITTINAYPNYLNASAVPMMLSLMMHFSDTAKQELYPSDDGLIPYITYGYMPPTDFNAPSSYDQPNPYTTLSRTWEHSANYSQAEYKYP